MESSASTLRSPIDVSSDEVLTKEQARIIRAAIAADHRNQSGFARAKDLHAGMLSEIINRERRPSAKYAEVLAQLVRRYLQRIRFTLSRIDNL